MSISFLSSSSFPGPFGKRPPKGPGNEVDGPSSARRAFRFCWVLHRVGCYSVVSLSLTTLLSSGRCLTTSPRSCSWPVGLSQCRRLRRGNVCCICTHDSSRNTRSSSVRRTPAFRYKTGALWCSCWEENHVVRGLANQTGPQTSRDKRSIGGPEGLANQTGPQTSRDNGSFVTLN